MIPFVVQAPETSPGGKGGLVLLAFGVVLLILIYVKRRRSRGTAGVTLQEARQELARLRRDGARDVSTEVHIGALLSWCTAYAVLLLVGFAIGGFVEFKTKEPRPLSERNTSRMFAVVLAAEAAGLWRASRGISRGSDRARWAASGLLTFLALIAVGAETFWSTRLGAPVRLPNLILHGAVAIYAVAGATFLLLPRCARVCSPEYRDTATLVDGPATRAALNLARTRSPYSWLPIIVLVSTAILGELLER